MTIQPENLGPAERIIQQMIEYSDHLNHGRPGLITQVAGTPQWSLATYKREGDVLRFFSKTKAGKKTVLVPRGTLNLETGEVRNGATFVGHYAKPGLVASVAETTYKKIAEVWQVDNELVARWGSFQMKEDKKDTRVMLAAFLLAQSRKGDRVKDGDSFFFDDDFRAVGEAMILADRKSGGFDPKEILRVYRVLTSPGVVKLNRELGFSTSRNAHLGRFPTVVKKYLARLESNPKHLNTMIKEGWRSKLVELARICGYKPETPRFFQALRWKQTQSKDGHRSQNIGETIEKAQSWEGLTEAEICERIQKEKPAWTRLVSLVPASVGITRAIAVCAVESGCLSPKTMVIATPTFEDLGILEIPSVKAKWEQALKEGTDLRAANIAQKVRSKDLQEKLAAGADQALKNQVEAEAKDLLIYVIVDISGSMEQAIVRAKSMLTQVLPAFPAANLKVATFHTVGREITFKALSAAGVQNAFAGIKAGGGTCHITGLQALSKYKPTDQQDLLVIWIGDEQESSGGFPDFSQHVKALGLRPAAFGLLRLGDPSSRARDKAVRQTALSLNIPCFEVDERSFADATYSVPQILRNLVRATPVTSSLAMTGTPSLRVSLIQRILDTPVLAKPAWA